MIAESFEFLFGLLGIAIAGWWLPKADFGLRWPRRETMVGKAILWGVTFGLIMLLVDQGARLVHGQAPTAPAVHAADIAGWLTFELFQVGICEELLFRGFLLGLLAELSPSRVRIGAFSLSTAGYSIALVFALAHAANFWTMAWPIALGQQIYALALGILYAWMRERSGSLIAPMLTHSVSDFVEYACVFPLAHLLPHG